MNVMQLLPMITAFMDNPQKGFYSLEQKLIPGWIELEHKAGAKLVFVINRNEDDSRAIVNLYKIAENGSLDPYESYSLHQLFEVLKNKNLIENAATTPEPAIAIENTGNDAGTEPTNG